MEGLGMSFWRNRRVFITGHTGFKGSWLSLYLYKLGASICGYALPPETKECMYTISGVDRVLTSVFGDICDLDLLRTAMEDLKPEIILHLAAQPLVRESYRAPVETYRVNVMGSLTVLEAARACKSVRSVVMVTTDKCYENREWTWGYRETDRLGGYDPYSSSKACAELAVASWRQSFFPVESYAEHGVGIATVRAGNVIGGGDWSADRLIPDVIRSLISGQKIVLRNPSATRPWQHVLEPVRGYLTLAEELLINGGTFAGAYNFGPEFRDIRPVGWVAQRLVELWGTEGEIVLEQSAQPHEAHSLKLDWSKAASELQWTPRLSLSCALERTAAWYRSWAAGTDMHEYSLAQISAYLDVSAANQEDD